MTGKDVFEKTTRGRRKIQAGVSRVTYLMEIGMGIENGLRRKVSVLLFRGD